MQSFSFLAPITWVSKASKTAFAKTAALFILPPSVCGCAQS